jgi:hypothetical protein
MSKMLSAEHKENRIAAAQSFLARYEEWCDDFLNCIVTRDETWVFHHTPQTKQQSMQLRHTHSPSVKKFITSTSTRKIMALSFRTGRGLFSSISCFKETPCAAAYCETLKRLRQAIQNKRPGMLTWAVCLLPDNARPHTARVTQQLLQTFKWQVLGHPPTAPISHQMIITCLGSWRNISEGSSLMTTVRQKMRCWGG